MEPKVRSVFWENRQVMLIDQRLLPGQFVVAGFDTVEKVAAAIGEMVVRGAPAIGATGAYGMALAAEAEADDTQIESEGVRIVVDPDSARLLNGAEIDYVEDLMKSGFTIYNPNATASCACGSSFQAADGSGSPRACH